MTDQCRAESGDGPPGGADPLPGRDPASVRRPVSDDELAAAMEAYAREELEPDPDVLGRSRGLLLAEFRREMAADQAGNAQAGRTAAIPRRRLPPFGWPAALRRPAIALAFAAALVVAGSGLVVAQSGPGQPFYHLRLAIETLNLPSEPGPARLDAQLDRLKTRISEAETAGKHGDSAAVADAMSAYEEVLDDVVLAGRRPDVSAEALSSALERHVKVLESLEAGVPPQAQAAIRRALENTSKASQAIEHAPGHDGGGGPGRP